MQGQQPAPANLLQWQPAAQPPPQPPQGAAGGGGAPTGLAAFGLSDATLQAFAAAMQGMVVAGVVSALLSLLPTAPGGKVARLSLLHLHFVCGVAGDSDLPPLWEAVVLGRGKTEGLATLNQALTRGLPSCRRLFGGRAHFSTSLPFLALIKNVSVTNPSLYPACAGGGFIPWLTWQGTVEAFTCGVADASLLAKQLDGRLALADSLCTAARVRLAAIPSAEEALRDLGTFAFIASHLFSTGRQHSSAVAELLRLIERLEELHTKFLAY